MRLNQFFPPPPVQKLNQLSKQKRPDNSEYRTHFTLMNVYCPTPSNYEGFIMKMAQKLRKYINCDIIQISEIVDDDRVDLAVGLQNDIEAMNFLLRNQQIKVDTQKHGQETYKLIISNVFKIYMNAKKPNFPIIQPIQPIKQKPLQVEANNKTSIYQNNQQEPSSIFTIKRKKSRSKSSSYSSSSNSSRSRSRSNYKAKQSSNMPSLLKKPTVDSKYERSFHSRSRSRSKSVQPNIAKVQTAVYQISFNQVKSSVMVQQIWVFCVPLEFDQRDVQSKLKQKKIFTQYQSSTWKSLQDMEFLQIRLQKPISMQTVQNMDLKINRYPCIVLPKIKSQSQSQLKQQMRKYQSQLISQKPLNQEKLLEFMLQIGGVVTIIKDDYDYQQKYITVWSSVSKVKQFQNKCRNFYGNSVKFNDPFEPLRLCRIEKIFSIQNVLTEYADRSKRQSYF